MIFPLKAFLVITKNYTLNFLAAWVGISTLAFGAYAAAGDIPVLLPGIPPLVSLYVVTLLGWGIIGLLIFNLVYYAPNNEYAVYELLRTSKCWGIVLIEDSLDYVFSLEDISQMVPLKRFWYYTDPRGNQAPINILAELYGLDPSHPKNPWDKIDFMTLPSNTPTNLEKWEYFCQTYNNGISLTLFSIDSDGLCHKIAPVNDKRIKTPATPDAIMFRPIS